MQTKLQEILVTYVIAENGVEGAKSAFNRLEANLTSLKGRKFYGTLLNDEYRACMAITNPEEASDLKLPHTTIPAGCYEMRKIMDWSKDIWIIGRTFDEMASTAKVDKLRPAIEFYRSQQELILYLPVEEWCQHRTVKVGKRP